MRSEYPNFSVIEESFKENIKEELENKKREMTGKGSGYFWFIPDFEFETFRQSFSNTAGLFQKPSTFSGQAFTDYYITVVYEHKTEIYGVYQGNKPVFIVKAVADKDFPAATAFHEDWANHKICALDYAVSRYGAIEVN